MADSTENTEYEEEPRNLACPYCHGMLYVTTEYSGGYTGQDEITGFECLEPGCGAEWDKSGKLENKPAFQRHPDIYEKPRVTQD